MEYAQSKSARIDDHAAAPKSKTVKKAGRTKSNKLSSRGLKVHEISILDQNCSNVKINMSMAQQDGSMS
jgi:hypothetical protein